MRLGEENNQKPLLEEEEQWMQFCPLTLETSPWEQDTESSRVTAQANICIGPDCIPVIAQDSHGEKILSQRKNLSPTPEVHNTRGIQNL